MCNNSLGVWYKTCKYPIVWLWGILMTLITVIFFNCFKQFHNIYRGGDLYTFIFGLKLAMGCLPELYYGHVVDPTNIGLINIIGIIYDINILIPQIHNHTDIILVKSPSNGIYARGWGWFEIK